MSSSLTCIRLTLFTVAAVAFQIIGLSFFVFGFFPVKPALSGDSGSESFHAPTCYSMGNESVRDLPPYDLQSLYQELSGLPPLFDRLILMVIDGLPAEFVLGKDDRPPNKALMEAMPYTQSLLANGIAKGYHAKAAPPTVTMPRLKAIVSGAIGGFLDVAFNFNTQALLDDNLLGQFSKVGWKMVMCGDETWLKLFPGHFMRHDGVSSFFVKDTVEVDKNVSRHLSYELSKNDWNLLILHYLGLDHVGHTGGRNSPLMAPKLMEMDEVVKMIHASAIMNPDDKRTLLVVASDHGMTENGNHGGSSYEETDSLLLFIGSKSHATHFSSIISNDVNQVDIAPTLALLFGVPIPKNNIGVMIPGVIDFLKDTHQLRALQLNSWQLLRLLQKQVPGFPCGSFPCDGFSGDQGYNSNDIMEKFCRLYLRSAFLHDSWISTELSRSDNREEKSEIIAAYYEFLINANQWLSHKATDKPSTVIVFGVMSMFLSFLIFSISIYSIIQESYSGEKQLSNGIFTQHLDEGFSLSVIFILVISMGSSSMVEEEQYIWHYLISTLNLLFLRKTMQFFKKESTCFFNLFNGHGKVCISSIFTLLITGRILRGWHQGGVNWAHLPDISKWLEQSGTDLQLIQLIAVILTTILILFSLSLLGRGMKIVLVVGFNFLMSGLLVFYHILRYQHNASLPSSNAATSLAQIIYATLGVSTVGTVLAVPWIMPIQISKACCRDHNHNSAVSYPLKIGSRSQYPELIYSLHIIGWVYIGSWCLLQLLLQQPVNSVVTLLILMQIFASFLFFSQGMLQQKQWVEVAVLYYIGMAGHFALGNSNSLATVDVAGAFIGISNYSALLSGILMFIITYASPTLLLLSMVMYISIKNLETAASPQNVDSGHVLKRILGLPCLVPLTINSILLIAYTIVLILMRNHLFVWSVFSPKYLYACATTVCVLMGVFVVATTVTYAYMVLALRKKY